MSKTDCVNIESNEENCPCSSVECDRRGVCCECIRAHLEKDSLPSCVRVRVQDSQPLQEYVTELVNQARE